MYYAKCSQKRNRRHALWLVIFLISFIWSVLPIVPAHAQQECSQKSTCDYPRTNTHPEESDLLITALHHHAFFSMMVFFGLGLLLSCSACMLPLFPILSGIILGQRTTGKRGAILLSLIYVLAVASTCAALGVIAGLAGTNLQILLQQPWMLAAFSLFFVWMACSLFGWVNMRLPQKIQDWLTQSNNKAQKSGTYTGTAIMGCLSILIASPCITPPLAAAVLYLSHEGNVFVAASALFCMGLGMGLPLLIISSVGSRFLPKSGRWMDMIKIFFGLLLLALAVSMLMRISAIQAIIQKTASRFSGSVVYHTIHRIDSLDQLQSELLLAKQNKRPVILEFYADWCPTCHEIDRTVFSDSRVKKILDSYVTLRVDITANTAATAAIQRYFEVVGPPTIVFFDTHGQELKKFRIVGAITVGDFLAINQALALQNDSEILGQG